MADRFTVWNQITGGGHDRRREMCTWDSAGCRQNLRHNQRMDSPDDRDRRIPGTTPVRQSIRRIEASPFVTKHESLRGFVFDVATGKLNEVTLDS